MSYFGDLIFKLQCKTSSKLVFTSILPRLVDHKITQQRVNKVNAELKKLCKRKHILYCNIYRSFLHNNMPDPSLYAPNDGLHLNFAGTDLLRKKIINIIRHLSLH